ncbi:MAG: immunoglobulin domain-containing protein [Crocinitomicaceae bacterium]|nr:immunoglobulin domain-containing protein [Crocinitomicaceae bacterium]
MKYFLFFTSFFLLYTLKISAQIGGVGINTSGAAPDPSAIIDANSTSQGALFPRMTTAQRNAIVQPAKGLYIYNLDCDNVNFNAGTPESPNWVVITSSNLLVAGVNVTVNPAGSVCEGTLLTFTASITNGGNSPTYQWMKNGEEISAAVFLSMRVQYSPMEM